jgi:ComF family protein
MPTLTLLKSVKENLIHLLFPRLCFICENELEKSKKPFCAFCYRQLPFAYIQGTAIDHPIQDLFGGRVELQHSYSLLYYEKKGDTQKLLHAIKYQNKPQLAILMGEWLGKEIAKQGWAKELDALIPVPIHPKKEFLRGYNQSEKLAKGIANVLDLPIDNTLLKRNTNDKSQTQQSGRFLRWDNIQSAFGVRKKKLMYKHVAIVDDVITTGVTIEKITRQLNEYYPEIRISVISLAFAK